MIGAVGGGEGVDAGDEREQAAFGAGFVVQILDEVGERGGFFVGGQDGDVAVVVEDDVDVLGSGGAHGVFGVEFGFDGGAEAVVEAVAFGVGGAEGVGKRAFADDFEGFVDFFEFCVIFGDGGRNGVAGFDAGVFGGAGEVGEVFEVFFVAEVREAERLSYHEWVVFWVEERVEELKFRQEGRPIRSQVANCCPRARPEIRNLRTGKKGLGAPFAICERAPKGFGEDSQIANESRRGW